MQGAPLNGTCDLAFIVRARAGMLAAEVNARQRRPENHVRDRLFVPTFSL
jgi:hypothetical protein